MKKILLSNGFYALIDDEDFELVSNWKWFAHKSRNTYYAVSTNKQAVKMHRVILGLPRLNDITGHKGTVVDHIDGNGLNNQRNNIRVVTNAENVRKSVLYATNTSGLKGVHFETRTSLWHARGVINGKRTELYCGNDFFEACCTRKSFETKSIKGEIV